MPKDSWMWLIILALIALVVFSSWGTSCGDACQERQAEEVYHERVLLGAP